MAGIRFCVKTDYEQARDIVEGVLADQGFSLDYSDPYTLSAERGSITATLLTGSFTSEQSQHLVLSVEFGIWDQGGQVVSVLTASTGMAAGARGVTRVQRAFREVTDAMREAFTQQGILEEVLPIE